MTDKIQKHRRCDDYEKGTDETVQSKKKASIKSLVTATNGVLCCSRGRIRTFWWHGNSPMYMMLITSTLLLPYAVLYFGSLHESLNVKMALSTHSNYIMSEAVCVRHQDGTFQSMMSSSLEETIATTAPATAPSISHCGNCGKCSSDSDIDLMIATKDSLTKDATRCALKGLIYGQHTIDECLQGIGFTVDCASCWNENIKCTISKCKFTCLKTKLYREPNNILRDDGILQLNDCLECDEKTCGTEFLRCAGANRRQLGIMSDIQREGGEQCRGNVHAT